MASSGELTASSLNPDLSFNWVFLVELLVCSIITIFFLFYFNRVFATLVSYGIRAWTWHKYRVYIEIQSLQFSLLAGRVFFKNLRYHGDNTTLLIHSGYVTWNYWLRVVREVKLGLDANTAGSRDSSNDKIQDETSIGLERAGLAHEANLPCRITLTLDGVECFVYNSAVVYDALVSRMEANEDDPIFKPDQQSQGTAQPSNEIKTDKAREYVNSNKRPLDNGNETRLESEKSNLQPPTNDQLSGWSFSSSTKEDCVKNEQPSSSAIEALILRFLPIHIQCNKAATVVGNENTRSVLILKTDKASGECDATSCTPLDHYRQLINFRLEHPVVQMKPNDDYKEDQTSAALRIKRGARPPARKLDHHVRNHSFLNRQRDKAWHSLQTMVPFLKGSIESLSSNLDRHQEFTRRAGIHQTSWQGLSRYLEESERNESVRWSSIEYAMVSTLLDSPNVSLSFYWDVPGIVQDMSTKSDFQQASGIENINCDEPPGWGLTMRVRGGTLNYGPWADRQRADIQSVFFPSLCKDNSPSHRLTPGAYRIPTQFKLNVEFDGETTLRMPLREDSKNWKWTKHADTMANRQAGKPRKENAGKKNKVNRGVPGPEVRPFGWLDIRVPEHAIVEYTMDMVAGPSGFVNRLDLDLPNGEITSSVNHGLLWRSVMNHITCDLSDPLGWKAQRNWTFDVASSSLELFPLREHIFLLTDLANDWACGSPPEYLAFVPYRYLLNIHLNDFKLHLNVNDANIVNRPADFDDNAFVVVFGSSLEANLSVPMEVYRPSSNDVSFTVEASHGGLKLHVPPCNTQATFLQSKDVAQLKKLSVNGDYHYFATTAPGNTDTLFLDVYGHAPTAKMYGFVIRYLMVLKDNYFGDDIRFKTLEEYQESIRKASNQAPPHLVNNDLDVVLSVASDEAAAIIPSNLYSAKHHVRIDIANVTADVRITNYYMELDVMLHTLAFSQGCEDDGSEAMPYNLSTSTQLFLGALNVRGNRLFGLPPSEPTYICNWDFSIGDVKGECTEEFLCYLIHGARAFVFSFDDDENALPSAPAEAIHDITFLRAQVDSIRIWIHSTATAFLVSTGTIDVDFNDWARSRYSKALNLIVPRLILACVDSESALRHRTRTQQPVKTHAALQTTFSLSMIHIKTGFEQDRQRQQEHVKRHDQRTHRAPFLIDHPLLDHVAPDGIDAPAISIPSMPFPKTLTNVEKQQKSSGSLMSSKLCLSTRKSSFLSGRAGSNSKRSVSRHGLGRRRVPAPNWQTQLEPESGEPTPNQPQDPANLIASSDCGSAFYSVAAEPRALPPSGVTFSSTYIGPSFPLESVEPDTSYLPTILSDFDRALEHEENEEQSLKPMQYQYAEESDHINLLLNSHSGISGFLNPQAVEALARLISALQASEPADLMDQLQIDSMASVLHITEQKQKKSEIYDVSTRMPSVRLRFLNSSVDSLPERQTHDQYDLTISKLALTLRTSIISNPDDSIFAKHASTLHLSMLSASLSAKERCGGLDETQAAVSIILRDTAFWAISKEDKVASVDIERLDIDTASGNLEYMASLIHRTDVMFNGLAEVLTNLTRDQQYRLRLFTYLVSTASHDSTEPLFLTRPSYVLRSTPNHLRGNDSWKVTTRLRYIYEALGTSAQRDISAKCSQQNIVTLPEGDQEQVIATFENWRSWDWENLRSSVVWVHIYGATMTDSSDRHSPAQQTKVAFRSGLARLVVDPGPKQNEVIFHNISTAIGTRIRGHDEHPRHAKSLIQSTVVQVFCADATITLNWELCVLVEDIYGLYQQSETGLMSDPSVTSISKTNVFGQELHLVVATEKGSLLIDTINVKAMIISQGLKTSLIMSEKPLRKEARINLMIAAELLTSNVGSHSQRLALSRLQRPSVFMSSHMRRAENNPTQSIQIAVNCQSLSCFAQRDLSEIIEAVDLIVGDEVAQLSSLKQKLAANKSTNVAVSKTRTSVLNIQIALFLDMYQTSLPLLHSLIYKVTGSAAKVSVSMDYASDVVFDLDIERHSHEVQIVSGQEVKSISLLHMPPTNGRLIVHMPEHEIAISFYASMEPINLDASAIYGLLVAASRPEMSNVIADLRGDVKSVQKHIAEVFGEPERNIQQAGGPLTYDVHLTLGGLGIVANTPGDHKDHTSTRLDLDFGSTRVSLANRAHESGPVLRFPRVCASLSQITFELSRLRNNEIESCGDLSLVLRFTADSEWNNAGKEVRFIHLKGETLRINVLAETASSVVDILGHLQSRLKSLDLSLENKYFRKLRKSRVHAAMTEQASAADPPSPSIMFASMYSLELLDAQITWSVRSIADKRRSEQEQENLVLSLKRLNLSTRKESSGRLTIDNLQLQMIPITQYHNRRSSNSALLPEVIFNIGYVSTPTTRRLAFQAAGKALDLRLTSHFILPAAEIQKSIKFSMAKLRVASAAWRPKPMTDNGLQARRQPFFWKKRMESLLVDADFAGAVVYLSAKRKSSTLDNDGNRGQKQPQPGRYAQFTQAKANDDTILRAPGLAWKIEYKDNGLDGPSLNAEVKVDASSNILYPAVVPLVLEVSSTIKEIVSDGDGYEKTTQLRPAPQKRISSDEENILTTDPSTVLGRTRLNLGIRICKQEFSLSCQPIARVAATAHFDDVYMTINTVRSSEHGHFFAASATVSKLQASVQHVYSRESTGSFDVDSIFLSLMNSKHVSGTNGLSAILKTSPMNVLLNVKQLQDFLLFREIWIPIEMRQSNPSPVPSGTGLHSHILLVQRYQQVASTGAFPWNATVSVAELNVQLDLGQAIGKSAFVTSGFWISSKKTSDWEQNLCLGFEQVGVESTGRLSGFVTLREFKARTSIQWPDREKALNQTPLVQGSIGFSQLRTKAAFDYQAFLVADITSFEFVMYNVRNGPHARGDRLVSILDGEAVQVFCTTTSASQALALYQALLRLAQEKRANYEASLKEIEKFMKRKTPPLVTLPPVKSTIKDGENGKAATSPISLHTDVVVTLKAVSIGAFPSTFLDHQVFKLEALNAQARFAVMTESGKIHSILSLTLGQLRIGLAGVKEVGNVPKSVNDISVEDVVESATGSRGGTILKVPKVSATMQTWQRPNTTHIEYLFKSSFEGKVEVGWNYSRISFIRSMWASHSKALAQRLGKPLPPSAFRITGVPGGENVDHSTGEQRKIRAEVNVPQSKYNYTALEPPIIETPQLRDMGEATPPLEWIGVHRDRLPNLTHQIVIVTLLELASEVEDAYSSILGSS